MNRAAILSLSALLIGQMPLVLRAEDTPPLAAGGHALMGEPMIENRIKHLTKKLDLTPGQQGQLKQFLQAETDQMKPLHEQMIAVRKQTDEKIQSVLTDAQKKKFSELREQQKQDMKARMLERGEKRMMMNDATPKI